MPQAVIIQVFGAKSYFICAPNSFISDIWGICFREEAIEMNRDIQKVLNERYEIITRLSAIAEEKVNHFPDGRIKVKRRKNGVYYYLTNAEYEDRLLKSSEIDLAKDLMQKSYFKKVIKASNEETQFLKYVIDNYPKFQAEDIYSQLSEDRKNLVKPITPTDEQFITNWQNQPYTPKPFKKEDPFFVTLRGERVRSKSEVIIADRLLANGIPYKYECPILVGNEIIHPDFSVLRIRDRKILYLEHNGKVGDQQYADDMVDRINKYEAAGIHQGDRLFLTYETANRPLDVRVLDIIINDLFK